MSMKPQYESYRYTGEVCRLHSQSIVECRLPGSEVGAVLAIQAKAIPTQCACADGEVRLGGKLLLCILYEDAERKICRVERGAEFYHVTQGSAVTPACFAKVCFSAENITHRREGSGLYVSVIVGGDVSVYGGKQMEYLIGGEDMYAQKQTVAVYKTVCVSGETEGEDEFETENVGDILLHSENAVVTGASANGGQIDVEGELRLGICVLKTDDTVCSYERLIPFSLHVPCEEAFGDVSASARVGVRSAELSVGIDEEKKMAKIVFTYTLSADCFLHAKEELSVVNDAFSPHSEIALKYANDGGMYLTNTVKCTERVSGVAAMPVETEGEYTLAAAILPRAEVNIRDGEAEGAVLADVLLKGNDGGYKATTLTLPVVFPVECKGDKVEADCMVCGLSLRRKKDGETEAEATLKVCLRCYDNVEWRYVSEVVEGEAIEENTAAISVYAPQTGEDLWQVAKRLRRAPEEVQKSNPTLEFPVREGERIVIYRQIT